MIIADISRCFVQYESFDRISQDLKPLSFHPKSKEKIEEHIFVHTNFLFRDENLLDIH